MPGYTSENLTLKTAASGVALTGTTVLTETFYLHAGDSVNSVFDITVTAVSGSTGTVQLQDSHDGATWFDSKSVTVSATGTSTLRISEAASGQADGQYLPLRPLARLRALPADSITITGVKRTRRL